MRRTLFKSKIHRATVTQADLDYEGSVTIDADLMRAADILPYEKVHIWNRTNGSRLETYALEAPAGLGRHLRQRRGRAPREARRHRHHRDVRRGEGRGRGARLEADRRSRRRAEPHRHAGGRTGRDPGPAAAAAHGLIGSDFVSRVETLKKFIAARPSDPFPRYGLAQEYKNAGQLAEARAEFDDADARSPRLHGGVPARGQRAARARRARRGARGLRARHRGVPAARRRPRDERARRRALVVRRVSASP